MANTISEGPGVSCRNVRKHFGSGEATVEALRGVDFETRFGELSFLVGPSGCGKTTLISIIAGLLDRTAGELSVLGTNVDALSASERVLFRRRNLGFIFQQFNLLPALTAAENVAVPLIAAGTPRRRAVDRAGALLSQLGLGSRAPCVALDAIGRPAAARGDRPRADSRAAPRRLRRADGRARSRERRSRHGAARRQRRPAGPHGHRRHPRHARLPLRPQHRAHGRRAHRGRHAAEWLAGPLGRG